MHGMYSRNAQEDESGRSRWQSQVVLAVKVDEKVELTEMTVVLVVEGSWLTAYGLQLATAAE